MGKDSNIARPKSVDPRSIECHKSTHNSRNVVRSFFSPDSSAIYKTNNHKTTGEDGNLNSINIQVDRVDTNKADKHNNTIEKTNEDLSYHVSFNLLWLYICL